VGIALFIVYNLYQLIMPPGVVRRLWCHPSWLTRQRSSTFTKRWKSWRTIRKTQKNLWRRYRRCSNHTRYYGGAVAANRSIIIKELRFSLIHV